MKLAIPFELRICNTLFYKFTDYDILCPHGEIGKHNRFKICRSQGLGGSSPPEGTTLSFINNSLDIIDIFFINL